MHSSAPASEKCCAQTNAQPAFHSSHGVLFVFAIWVCAVFFQALDGDKVTIRMAKAENAGASWSPEFAA